MYSQHIRASHTHTHTHTHTLSLSLSLFTGTLLIFADSVAIFQMNAFTVINDPTWQVEPNKKIEKEKESILKNDTAVSYTIRFLDQKSDRS